MSGEPAEATTPAATTALGDWTAEPQAGVAALETIWVSLGQSFGL